LVCIVAAVSVWIRYVAWNSTSFQACIADKQSQQSQESLSELSRFFEMKARVGTDCLFVFLYQSRDAVTAVATAFIAIFTLTLWWATWGLLTHGREIERAYVSGGGPLDPATRIFQLQINIWENASDLDCGWNWVLRVEEYSTISPIRVDADSRYL